MSYFKSLTAALVLLGAGNAHMIMKTPTPYGAGSIDNSPLTAANYPCKAPATGADAFYSRSAVTKMAIGEKQTLSFTGTAVHGGGSCQLAITSDLKPSKSTHWQVILSIEGGCPSTADPVNPSTYDYSIPMGITPGQYSFGWTWISHTAGQPEYYMDCSAIEVTAPKSKRSVNSSMEIDSLVKRSALPDLFVGNLAGINDCKTVPGTDPLYPDPGDTILKPAGDRNYQKIAGSNCCPEGKCQGGGASSPSPSTPSSPSSSSGSSSSIDTSGLVVSPVESGGVAPATSIVVNAQASAAASGFASGEATSAASTPSAAASSIVASSSNAATSFSITPIASAASSSSTTSVASSTYASTMSTAVVSSQAAAAAATSQSSSASSSTTGGMTGPCTSEGMFNCVSSQYQQCASGAWTVLRPMAAGTQCKEGQSMGLWAKRSEGGAFHRRRGFN